MQAVPATPGDASACISRISRICFVGALDAHTVTEARILIDETLAGRPRKVIVDLARLDRIDSVGVSALVSLYKRVTAQRGSVLLVNVHDQPLTVLKLLKLTSIFGL